MSVKTTILYINTPAVFTSSILTLSPCSIFYSLFATPFLKSCDQNCSWLFVPVTRSVLTQDPQFCNAKLLCFLRSCNTFCVNAGPSVL